MAVVVVMALIGYCAVRKAEEEEEEQSSLSYCLCLLEEEGEKREDGERW